MIAVPSLSRWILNVLSRVKMRSHELKKFIPMAALMFTILLSQNLLRVIKDSLIVTSLGAEVIGAIKLWGEMPAGILFVMLYTILCNKVTTERAFQIVVTVFLSFFVTFAFVIYPNAAVLHPNPQVVESLIQHYPYAKIFLLLWSKWSFVIFYIMGELWPLVVFSLLFWQLANKITSSEEATRFYLLFGIFGQTNLIISGITVPYFASGEHIFTNLFSNITDKTEVFVKSLMIVVIIASMTLLRIHRFIVRNVMTDVQCYKPKVGKLNDTLKLGVKDSIRQIMKSKYLLWICIMVCSYSVVINLVEGLWFSKVRELYPNNEDFAVYQSKVLLYTGVFTLIVSSLGGSIIRHYGWRVGASITPLAILISGGSFLLFVLYQNSLDAVFLQGAGLSALYLITIAGGLQNILGKGTKYSLFDATKEMSYIPLDSEMKTKGKAAVDVIGSKVGKSLGAMIQWSVFTIFPNAKYDDLTGLLLAIFCITCLLWLYSVKMLSVEYSTKLKDQQL